MGQYVVELVNFKFHENFFSGFLIVSQRWI
jgi:hypothetical protein